MRDVKVDRNKLLSSDVSRDELYVQYIVNNLTLNECAAYFNSTVSTIRGALKYYSIVKDSQTYHNKVGETQRNFSKEKRLEIRNKTKTTNLIRYGDENYNNIEKHKQTRISNSGSLEQSYVNSINKGLETKINKYGSLENAYKIAVNHMKKTLLNTLGVDNVAKDPEIQRKCHIRYTYDNHYFDSSWELALWIYAKDHGEHIEQPNIRFEYTYNNKIYGYFPDFIYKGKLIEIKGDHLRNGNIYDSLQNEKYLLKYKCAIDNNVMFMYHDDIEFALKYVYKTYGKDYMKNFKNNTTKCLEGGDAKCVSQ